MTATASPLQALPEIAAILDGYRDPAVLLSPDYRILAANQAYLARYGGGMAVVGQRCHQISHHSPLPCDQAGEHCPLRHSLRSGEPQRVLHLHHTAQGEEHVDVETRPIRDAGGKVRYLVEVLRPTHSASAHPRQRGLVGRSPAFNRMLELVERVAPSEATVLLLGESGTGKEEVARTVHELSPRRHGAFVPVECSGLNENLFESELFGHERGAFTGAHTRTRGLVEAASGGTLFLDEVGDIPLALQVKLLRLLETGTYRRVGSAEPQRADFRLVCATHRDLKAMVRRGEFREDLYYRIGVFPITLPPLRERRDDLPLLVDTLLRRISPERPLRLSPAAELCLQTYPFPGNVRELRNILERATLLADGETIHLEHLPDEVRGAAGDPPDDDPDGIVPLAELERRYLAAVAARFHGDKRELARRLGISERTLYRKLRELREA